jgi:hypothetical protein
MCFLPKKCYKNDMSLLLLVLGILIGGILISKFANRCSNCGSYGTKTKKETVSEIIATIACIV